MTNIELKELNQILESDAFAEISRLGDIDNEDVIKILQKSCSSFRYNLSQGELASCCITALWKALDRYTNDSRCKFTTYLYKGVQMECLSQKKFNKSKLSFGGKIHSNIQDPKSHYEHVDMLDEIQFACEDPSLVLDRFYNNMTIKEIAENRGVCGETIRIRLNKNLKKLGSSLLKSV